MAKKVCLHLENYPHEINGRWYNWYKCKYSNIEIGSTTKKRLCNECKKQYKLEFK